MLNSDSNERGKKCSYSQKKKELCTCRTPFCKFLCRCFARLQRETDFLVDTFFLEQMSS